MNLEALISPYMGRHTSVAEAEEDHTYPTWEPRDQAQGPLDLVPESDQVIDMPRHRADMEPIASALAVPAPFARHRAAAAIPA
jgi:hypothetical protein